MGDNGYYTYGMGGLEGLVQGPTAPLRELLVEGLVDYNHRVDPLFPYLSTLRRLELRIEGCLDMPKLLAACPSLEALHIQGNVVFNTHSDRDILEARGKDAPILLRTLILGHVRYEQKSLEALLSLCTHLQELKLFRLTIGPYSWYTNIVPADYARLLTHIRSLSLPLEKLYVSINEEEMTGEMQSRLLEMVPVKNEFFTWDFPLDVIQVVRQQAQNTITTLDLVGTPLKCGPDSTLHRYLCSSPHLLHLRAVRCEYLVNHMDLHRRLSDSNGPEFENIPAPWEPRIWACSKLETLHVGSRSIGNAGTQGPAPQLSEQTRILFGYLSRVTPRLRDLHLYCGPYPNTQLTLESGLCLLARLRKLERLKITSFPGPECKRAEDLEWMMKGGHSPEMRAKRLSLIHI